MKIIEVTNLEESRQFIRLSVELYEKQAAYIRPLDKDIENVFDPKVNQNFENEECIRWILRSDDQVIGRIAAFTRGKASLNGSHGVEGGIGFFECINDQGAADLLFDTAREWLIGKGATFMDGPINFGKRDKWWGLLTQGYELEPNYQCNYHLPYYKKLFEDYGFEVYFEQFTFTKQIQDPLHPRLTYKAELVKKDPGYTVEHFRLRDIEAHTKAIVEIYNRAWVNHEGVSALSLSEGEAIMNELRPILDEKIIWLVFYHGEPVAFYVNIPEANQLLKYAKGRMDMLGKLKFLWHRWRGTNRKIVGMVFGIVPEHQGKGVDGAMIMAFADMVRRSPKKYETIEINGIGDFNRKMILVIKQVGGKVCKVHTTYRYLFDRKAPFERMKPI